MKECLECKSTSIRYERSIKSFVCENCGFTIAKADLYRMMDKNNKSPRNTKEEQRKELYKWLISKKQ